MDNNNNISQDNDNNMDNNNNISQENNNNMDNNNNISIIGSPPGSHFDETDDDEEEDDDDEIKDDKEIDLDDYFNPMENLLYVRKVNSSPINFLNP